MPVTDRSLNNLRSICWFQTLIALKYRSIFKSWCRSNTYRLLSAHQQLKSCCCCGDRPKGNTSLHISLCDFSRATLTAICLSALQHAAHHHITLCNLKSVAVATGRSEGWPVSLEELSPWATMAISHHLPARRTGEGKKSKRRWRDKRKWDKQEEVTGWGVSGNKCRQHRWVENSSHTC